MPLLSDYQAEFTYAICRFIATERYIRHDNAIYRVRLDYAKRSKEENARIGGHPNSTHLHRLAVDLIVDKSEDNGDTWIIAVGSEDTIWTILHDRWENKYGGAKRIPEDLGHFSFEYRGVR